MRRKGGYKITGKERNVVSPRNTKEGMAQVFAFANGAVICGVPTWRLSSGVIYWTVIPFE
ncbi:MAG TPA: hypothetical protein VK644_07460 [Chitinophagaceae bacterium]|nr:hypothetical protein [Chitinophagaceae bacterium]